MCLKKQSTTGINFIWKHLLLHVTSYYPLKVLAKYGMFKQLNLCPSLLLTMLLVKVSLMDNPMYFPLEGYMKVRFSVWSTSFGISSPLVAIHQTFATWWMYRHGTNIFGWFSLRSAWKLNRWKGKPRRYINATGRLENMERSKVWKRSIGKQKSYHTILTKYNYYQKGDTW